MPSRARAQAGPKFVPESLPEPEPVPPADTGAVSLYRVIPADGSSQLLIDWDQGHTVQAGSIVHAPIYTDLHRALGGLLNLQPLPAGGMERLREQTGTSKGTVSN